MKGYIKIVWNQRTALLGSISFSGVKNYVNPLKLCGVKILYDV